jgi:hypothetical protein
MKKFIFTTRDYEVLVIAENEDSAKIKFAQEYPSLKVRSIKETDKEVFIIG